jgi:hypothetical protein
MFCYILQYTSRWLCALQLIKERKWLAGVDKTNQRMAGFYGNWCKSGMGLRQEAF